MPIVKTSAAPQTEIYYQDIGAGEQVVLMPLDEFNSWQESLYLLASPKNAAHLRRSIAEAESGQAVKRELSAE